MSKPLRSSKHEGLSTAHEGESSHSTTDPIVSTSHTVTNPHPSPQPKRSRNASASHLNCAGVRPCHLCHPGPVLRSKHRERGALRASESLHRHPLFLCPQAAPGPARREASTSTCCTPIRGSRIHASTLSERANQARVAPRMNNRERGVPNRPTGTGKHVSMRGRAPRSLYSITQAVDNTRVQYRLPGQGHRFGG